GWLPNLPSPLHGFHGGLILIEILVVIHGLWDLSIFKFPLLVLAAAGGGVLWLWHTSDTDWIVIAIIGLLYVWLGGALERSSWTVIGAFGLFLSTMHYVDEWFGSFSLFPFFGLGGSPKHDWARPIGYAVLGFVFLLV